MVDLPASDFITEISLPSELSVISVCESSAKMIPADSVIVSTRAVANCDQSGSYCYKPRFQDVVIEDCSRVIPEYVALMLTKLVPTMQAWATENLHSKNFLNQSFVNFKSLCRRWTAAKEIVSEIAGYQKIIDGASCC